MTVTLAELAQRFGGRIRGKPDLRIDGVATLDTAGPYDIAYVASKDYLKSLARTSAGAVILTEADAKHYSGVTLIIENPHLCYAQIATLLNPVSAFTPGVHPTAVVDKDARITPTAWVGPHVVIEAEADVGAGAFIGPGCYIGHKAIIGDRARLTAYVTINSNCEIGADCILHPGSVIGCDGFGYANDGKKWVKVPQLGRVIIGNDVEIGANTTIDRGTLSDTVIGHGVKLDNLIQIAHNVQIGDHTAIAACVGIAGSAKIGRRCTIGGQAGILGHLEIADDVHITATTLVTNSITQSGTYSSGLKASPLEKWRKNAARLQHLDEMSRRLRQLEEKLQRLTKE